MEDQTMAVTPEMDAVEITTETESPTIEQTTENESENNSETTEKSVKTPEGNTDEQLAPKSQNRFQEQANRIREQAERIKLLESQHSSDPMQKQIEEQVALNDEFINQYENNPYAKYDAQAAAQYAHSVGENMKLQGELAKSKSEFYSRMGKIESIERNVSEFNEDSEDFDKDLLSKFHTLTIKNKMEPDEAKDLVIGSYKKGQSLGAYKATSTVREKRSENKVDSSKVNHGVDFDKMTYKEMDAYLKSHPEMLK